MDTPYVPLIPLFAQLALMAYILALDPRDRANRLTAAYLLCLSVGDLAVVVMTAAPFPGPATAGLATLLALILGLNSFFLVTIVLALYHRPHLTRWYGWPLSLSVAIAVGVAIVADLLAGWGLFTTGPTMGQSNLALGQSVRGSLAFIPWAWFFAGLIASLGLLAAAWVRTPPGWRAPIGWLLLSLAASGALTPLLPPHPLGPTLNLLLFAVAFAVALGRSRPSPPATPVLEAVFRNSAEGVVACDSEGRVERINPAAQRLAGIAAEEAIGWPVGEVLAPFLRWAQEDEGARSLAEFVARGVGEPFQATLRMGETLSLVLRVSALPIMDDGGRHTGCLLTLRDVTEDERVRRAMEAQAQLVKMIHELSMPIVPVMEGILILPLVGAIDTERAESILPTMLAAIHQHRARAILIDITAVPVVDSSVANHLLQAVRAAALLGCQGILVGIRAEVASTLTELGVDLHDLVTRGTLQDGLTYAMQMLDTQAEAW